MTKICFYYGLNLLFSYITNTQSKDGNMTIISTAKKRVGDKWDKNEKSHYAPKGLEINKFSTQKEHLYLNL